MTELSADPKSSANALLSKISRYEALLELTAVINAASDIESVGNELARRLKYIVDAYAWRYFCFEGDPEDTEKPEATAIVVDGFRGGAGVKRTTSAALSSYEISLWNDRKTGVLCGERMSEALKGLPEHFRRDDLEQISVNSLVENGKTKALFLFCRRRQPFTELDTKCLSTVCSFFHRKVIMLWERQKLRDLELAYLQQEVTLRQSERLATLGRLSAGMAHELNNPAAAAIRGATQLRAAIAQLERAHSALGAGKVSSDQQEVIAKLVRKAEDRVKEPRSLDSIARNDIEQDVEEWLDQKKIEDSWEHAPRLVAMGFTGAELDDTAETLDPSMTPLVIDYVGSRFAVLALVEDVIGGTQRISEVVKALKGYSFMDQAPVQMVDVREGLNDTLVMLNSKLSQGISVTRDFADHLPRIPGYGSELNQVWTHLIDNAISAIGEEGALDLRAYRGDDAVIVEIADSGPGIPIDVQAKIFDPFFTTKAPGEGTGLGLSVSHGIVVEKHRGQISVDSEPGATRFAVKLPITDESSAVGADAEVFTGRK